MKLEDLNPFVPYESQRKTKKTNIMKTIRTNLMSMAMLVGSALGFGGGVALAQDDFRQEHHHKREAVGARIADALKGVLAPDGRYRYQEGSDGGYQERRVESYQEGYHFAFRRGFDDGLNGRSYENRANTTDEYAGYAEGYRRGKAKFAFMQAQW